MPKFKTSYKNVGTAALM